MPMSLDGMRPGVDLLFELSLYHYDTKDAVFSGPPIYSTSDVETTGGELTFDYRASNVWNLQGGYSIREARKTVYCRMISPSPWRV